MYAIIDYKGQQILIEEGKEIKFPYLKDLEPGKTIELDKVLYFFDGKNKKIGNPFIKSFSIKGKVVSHIKDSKVLVFKMKRRKGHQKKNGHKQPYTLLEIGKFKSTKTKAATKSTKSTDTTKKSEKKKPTTTKKTTAKKKDKE